MAEMPRAENRYKGWENFSEYNQFHMQGRFRAFEEGASAQCELDAQWIASQYREVLDVAREAIVDAICCEDGLDGATGESVVRWITDKLGDYEEFIKTHTDDRWLKEQ